KLRQVFNQGVAEYLAAGIMASRYIGGIYHRRDHLGDPGGRAPFRVVEADKQRAALDFLIER
ncbi:MAG: zinc-dependent metalloprotease, partial [Calditrichaeota bacterium]|nr:zinc-dependent metalloprotease [Calditrichota bacterium]